MLQTNCTLIILFLVVSLDGLCLGRVLLVPLLAQVHQVVVGRLESARLKKNNYSKNTQVFTLKGELFRVGYSVCDPPPSSEYLAYLKVLNPREKN